MPVDVKYTTTATATGGRDGRAATKDGSLDVKLSTPKLGFGQLCGVAERVDDAIAEGGAEFCRLALAPGGEETLLPPELAPNRGERVSEGGPLLAVPSCS